MTQSKFIRATYEKNGKKYVRYFATLRFAVKAINGHLNERRLMYNTVSKFKYPFEWRKVNFKQINIER